MEQEKKTKENEIPEGYYSNVPKIGNRGHSRLWRELSKGMVYFVVVAAGIVFYFALLRLPNLSEYLWKALDVLKPILYGLLIAFILNPVVKRIERLAFPFIEKRVKSEIRAEKISKSVGVLAAFTMLFVLVSIFFNMLIPELYISIRRLVFTLPSQVNHLLDEVDRFTTSNTNMQMFIQTFLHESVDSFEQWISTTLLDRANEIMTMVTTGVIDIVNEVFDILIGMIVSIYVLFSREVFSKQSKKITYALLSPHNANLVLHITQKANEIFGGFFVGKIVDSAIIGVLCFVGLSILNMPYTLLVSVIVGVTNVIPFFGPYIGAVPSAILILLVNPMKGLYFVLFVIVLQQLDGNFIGPKILGSSTGLSSFWVIFAILLGGGLFGFPGMILGVPTFAVLYYMVQLFVNSRLHKKHLPESSDYYDEFSYVDETGKYVISKEYLEKMHKTMKEIEEEENADSSTE